VAVILSLWVFSDYASLVMVFLTTMACIPLVYNTMKVEEHKDLEMQSESLLLKEHGRALEFLMFLFVGVTLAFAFWYAVLPENLVDILFHIQSQTIINVNAEMTGNAVRFSTFTNILFNNLKVLIFCTLFAFIYGVGAIFILVWNASVIGTAIGNFVRSNLEAIAEAVGFTSGANYFHVVSFALLRYSIHGIPEILAYFTAGLAGGIISIAVIRHDFGSDRFQKILLDSSDLLIISIVLLVVSALLEVYVTPFFF
ncbi:stage II sporulation protein M, partial [Candidatus Woesearchaeota archaeon]